MALKQMVVQIGTGVDLHGQDYSKAACRAVEDAIQRNSLNFVRNLGRSLDDIQVHVVVAVPQPAKIDKAKVLAALPWGKKSLEAVQGGMELPCGKDTSSEASQDVTVIANAAITVSLDVP